MLKLFIFLNAKNGYSQELLPSNSGDSHSPDCYCYYCKTVFIRILFSTHVVILKNFFFYRLDG